MATKIINLIGNVYSKLTVVALSDRKEKRRTFWVCKCECGNTTIARGDALKYGGRVSCGCTGNFEKSHIKHGMANSKEYQSWEAMKSRCYNPKIILYENYGGRGITVCDRWINSFENFFADMGFRPTPKHSLDRFPNTDGNYEPGNCRWATRREQDRNLRKNIWIEYNGVTKILQDWAEELGCFQANISARLKRGQSFSSIYEYYNQKYIRDDS